MKLDLIGITGNLYYKIFKWCELRFKINQSLDIRGRSNIFRLSLSICLRFLNIFFKSSYLALEIDHPEDL